MENEEKSFEKYFETLQEIDMIIFYVDYKTMKDCVLSN